MDALERKTGWGSPAATVLEAAAYMAWADGRIAPEEVSAARGVATVLGVAELGTVGPGMLSRGPVEPAVLSLERLGRRERELVYATAAWIAMADGVVDTAEQRALRILQGRLGLGAERCADIEELVYMHSGEGDWDRRYASVLNSLGAG